MQDFCKKTLSQCGIFHAVLYLHYPQSSHDTMMNWMIGLAVKLMDLIMFMD